MYQHLSIGIATGSLIVFNGLCSMLREIRSASVTLRRIDPATAASDLTWVETTDILITDPIALNPAQIHAVKQRDNTVKVLLIYQMALPKEYVRLYDGAISLYDDARTVETAVLGQLAAQKGMEASTELTEREKDVVRGVVKGKANKEIAAELGLSVNTVMTHRRNIAAKLEIHSPAGLTVFALVSGLVKLEEVAAT